MNTSRPPELKKEINETLMFFFNCDINFYGEISEGTKKAFKAQGVELPDIDVYLKQLTAEPPGRAAGTDQTGTRSTQSRDAVVTFLSVSGDFIK